MNNEWPIQPSFLSIRKGIKDYSSNKDGLLRTDEICGFLARASNDLQIDHILALFQVVPGDFEDEDNDNRIFEAYFPENP